MGLQIEDGKGRGMSAGINANNKILVNAEANTTSHWVSVRDGLCFNWVSEDDDAAANDYIFYLKNDDTDRVLIIDLLRCSSENAATFKIWEVTGTASGSNAITAKNMNLGSGITQSDNYTSRGDGAVSGLTVEGSMIATCRTAANTSFDIPFDDTLILAVGKAIAVEYDTGTTGDAEILVRGYFLDLDNEI